MNPGKECESPNEEGILSSGELLGVRERIETAVHGMCCKYSPNPLVDTDDIIQDAWISLWKHCLKAGNAPERLSAYVATIARNAVLRAFRRAVAKQRLISSLDCGVFVEYSYVESAPSESMATSLFDKLLKDVSGGDERKENVFRMRLEGYTFEEISVKLCIRKAAARQILRRLRLALAKHLKQGALEASSQPANYQA